MQILKKLIIYLAGLLFAVYAAYNVFIIVRDSGRGLPLEGIIISAVVALMFVILSAFAWLSEVKIRLSTNTLGLSEVKNIRFLIIRDYAFIFALVVIFGLKLRMAGQVIAYFNIHYLQTGFYVASYVMTQIALLILIIYYAFILNRAPFFPRAAVIFPLVALILFLLSLMVEILLFLVFRVNLEANPLRTMIMRPVFYLAFICLSGYFLFPPPLMQETEN